MLNFKLLAIGYLTLVIGLFFYSYTQVDLNLTLSQWSVWQVIQTSFQYIGWFQRPLSTALYLVLIFLLSTFYLLLSWLAKNNKLSMRQFWLLNLIMSGILLFSYNAFSYDLFNYMFDARIVTYHGENPYFHKALDYPEDPWVNFMRWTHRTYPYGPVWLGLTVPLSFIGFQFFLPTLFLFKGLMTASFLGTVYFIGRILEKHNPKQKLFGMALFAFNPLVIIESLVSGHHDIVMIFLLISSIYYIMNSNYIRSILLFVLSIGIKFSSAILLPVVLWMTLKKFRNQAIDWERVFLASLFLSIATVILASFRTELQPWYIIWALPFVSLLPDRKWIIIPSIIISFALLLHYVPFLYTGNWDPPIPTIKSFMNISALVLAGVWAVWYSKEKVIQ